jgi:hypothetical protein
VPVDELEIAGFRSVSGQRPIKRIPRHGLANPYKRKEKAQKAAEILTAMHRREGWSYTVIDYEAARPTWVVLRQTTDAKP